MTVTVNQLLTPSFTQVPAICSGQTFILPTVSTNGVTGSWSPTINNTATTTYTFTPNAGQCASSATMTVEVNSRQSSNIIPISSLCTNDAPVQLIATPAGGIFSGSGVNSNGLLNPSAAMIGNITINYTVNNPCIAPSTLVVVVNQSPTGVSAGPDLSIITGSGINLQGDGSGNLYQWTPQTSLSNSSILTPYANPTQTTTYVLTVQNNSGCIEQDSMVLYVNSPCFNPMKIFTPNGDGFHERWIVYNGNCIKKVEASVYNRYGSLVYYSPMYNNDWDGRYKNKPLPDATYYYVLDITDVNGNRYTKKGTVTIMR
jgi:gliding motility-associated-like protein